MRDRELLVTETFVDLVDTLASGGDIGEYLHLLVERCRTVLAVTTSGVLMEAPGGELRLVAATSPQMQRLERAELDRRNGPCFDAYRMVETVHAPDLREQRQRWPTVVEQALDMGLLAAYAFPIRLGGDCIGAVNLYREEPGAFDPDDVRLGQAFAIVAAIGVLQHRRVDAAELRAEQLQHALDSRVLIEQAKGVLHERHGVSTNEAFERLRAHARGHSRKLRDVCRDVIDGKLVDL